MFDIRFNGFHLFETIKPHMHHDALHENCTWKWNMNKLKKNFNDDLIVSYYWG